MIPAELVGLIISNISSCIPTLRQCSLVNSTWLSYSRSYVFHEISLSQYAVSRFLELCDSPYCTFPIAAIHNLYIGQNCGTDDDIWQNCDSLNTILSWKASDGSKRTISSMLSRLETLTICCVGLRTLSQESKKNLLTGFRTVRNLKLKRVGFSSYVKLASVLQSFPLLETLELGHIEPFIRSDPEPSRNSIVSIRLPNLRSVSLDIATDNGSVEIVNLLNPCPTLKSFKGRFVTTDPQKLLRMRSFINAVEQLLLSARSSFEELNLTVDDLISLAEFDIQQYPSLRSLTLTNAGPDHDAYSLNDIDELLQTLTSSSSLPLSLRTLTIPSLPVLLLFPWSRIDTLLQNPAFSSLSALKFDVRVEFGPGDVTVQSLKSGYILPDESSAAARKAMRQVERVERKLPGCKERGLLAPEVKFIWVYD